MQESIDFVCLEVSEVGESARAEGCEVGCADLLYRACEAGQHR